MLTVQFYILNYSDNMKGTNNLPRTKTLAKSLIEPQMGFYSLDQTQGVFSFALSVQ